MNSRSRDVSTLFAALEETAAVGDLVVDLPRDDAPQDLGSACGRLFFGLSKSICQRDSYNSCVPVDKDQIQAFWG